MPGDNAGPSDGPFLRYLKPLQDLDRKFTGFGHDIHGVEPQADGTYQVMCLTNYD
jgi:arginine decarboxylase